jgi:hypothetical protein
MAVLAGLGDLMGLCVVHVGWVWIAFQAWEGVVYNRKGCWWQGWLPPCDISVLIGGLLGRVCL